MKTAYKTICQGVAQTLLVCLIAAQSIQAVQAVSTDIADIPMAVKNTASPNIMFTLDDSGSMQWEIMPDDITYFAYLYPRPSGLYGGTDYANQIPDFNSANIYNVLLRSRSNNKIYYDPAVTYTPWAQSNGASWADAPITCAPHNPQLPALGCRNLTANQTVNMSGSSWWYGSSGWYQGNHTFYPAVYYRYNGGGIWSTGNYTQIQIISTTATYTGDGRASRTDCTAGTCTYAQEIQNFANWYTYFRSRILLSRAGVGKAFAAQGNNLRVGFAAINKGNSTIDGVANTGVVIRGVRPFTGTDRADFFSNLYGHVIPVAGTPLRTAVSHVGGYYERTDDPGPWGEFPGTVGGTQHACRQSYNILMSDGYWNDSVSGPGNADGTAGSTITNDSTPATPANYTYTPGAPYSDAFSNTLADYAMHYWKRDLRPDLANKVQTNTSDPAFWQHMVTFTVGLGVSGTLPPPPAAPGTWPDPALGNAQKLDDFWHAAVNSRGEFFSAANPTEFATTLTATINNIIGRNAGAAAVAVSNANVTGSDNQSYASKYNSGNWSGDLLAYPINLTTGVPDTSSPTWTTSAQPQLDLRTSANRKIISYTGTSGTGQGIQFQPTSASTTTKLSVAQQALLNSTTTPPGTSDGANVVAYLRGDRSLEGTSYRTRAHLLGDIINAEPLVVREPFAHYADTCYATAVTGKCVTSFKTDQASRTRIVYQGANDGMLHAFNAASGAEEWAYIPNLLMSNLNNLSRKTGFVHKYYVDGTPTSVDVDFSNTDGVTGNPNPSWKTILVGGLNKGGRGYYALDITAPAAADESAAAQKVLWEFPNSATTATVKNNTGYSYGKPVIVKTAGKGWVALVTSGYNNGADTGGDGHGYLFVLNARTGDLIKAMDTGEGLSTDPSGLAQITAYVENSDIDNTVSYVYGGDLKGNVWRFDLTATNPNSWNVKRLAILKDGIGNTQPVTTVPELAKITISGTDKRFVYVGTGKYLGDSDVATTGTQTMYALVDDLSSPVGSTPVIGDPTRSSLQVQTLTTSGTTRTATTTTVDFALKKGWYVDMPASGERINTDPALVLGALVFTSNIHSSDVCTPGGSSWLNVLDYKTGGKLTGSTVAWSSIFLGDALASRVVPIKLPSGEVKALVRTSDAATITTGVPVPSSSTTGRRASWRELLE